MVVAPVAQRLAMPDLIGRKKLRQSPGPRAADKNVVFVGYVRGRRLRRVGDNSVDYGRIVMWTSRFSSGESACNLASRTL